MWRIYFSRIFPKFIWVYDISLTVLPIFQSEIHFSIEKWGSYPKNQSNVLFVVFNFGSSIRTPCIILSRFFVMKCSLTAGIQIKINSRGELVFTSKQNHRKKFSMFFQLQHHSSDEENNDTSDYIGICWGFGFWR